MIKKQKPFLIKYFNIARKQSLKEKKRWTSNERHAANMLKLFYAEARIADNTCCSKSILSSLRFGLNRRFKAARSFDIINDSEFTDGNKAKCEDLKWQGLAKVEHKPPICEEKDLKNFTNYCLWSE